MIRKLLEKLAAPVTIGNFVFDKERNAQDFIGFLDKANFDDYEDLTPTKVSSTGEFAVPLFRQHEVHLDRFRDIAKRKFHLARFTDKREL